MIETLYKRTAIGIYSTEVLLTSFLSDKGSEYVIRTKYGLLNGKKVTINSLGNAKKFAAVVKKKRQEGYRSMSDIGAISIDELDKLLPIYNSDLSNTYKSMKCQPFVANKFDYADGAHGQPKINGNRISITYALSNDGLFSIWKPVIKSHEGIILKIKHIEDAIAPIFKHCPKDTVFDGEIYRYGEPVTSISGAAKNPKNPIHRQLTFHCFDLAIPDVDQATRLEMKHKYLKKIEFPGICEIQRYMGEHERLKDVLIVDVLDVPVRNDEEASELREVCIDAGYEGCVIRNPNATYRFGSRPSIMMKLKKPKYGMFEVLDIIPFGDSKDNNVGLGCKFVLRNDLNAKVFESNSMGTVAEKEELVKNKSKYIGTKVTVKYFERSVNTIPFHTNVLPINPVAVKNSNA